MSTTAPWRTVIARRAPPSHPARLTARSTVGAQASSKLYSTQIQNVETSEPSSKAGPSSSKRSKPTPQKQRHIILHPQPTTPSLTPTPQPAPTLIPYPHPQTRFEQGFAARLRTWGLPSATSYLVHALREKHTPPRNPGTGQVKLLGVMPAFLSAVLRALEASASTGERAERVVERPLGQAMALLQIVRGTGRGREQGWYAGVIKALLARGHVEEATKLYAELVVDWNVLLASGDKSSCSFEVDASADTKAAVRMIAGPDDALGLYRDMPGELRREDKDGVRWPFPQAAVLNAICRGIAREIQGAEEGAEVDLEGAMESIRVLATLLYYKQLPYGTTYRSYEPLLKVMSMVPAGSNYPVWVRLRGGEGLAKGEEWMKVRTRGKDGRVEQKVPEVFKTTLPRFCRTLLKSIHAGRS